MFVSGNTVHRVCVCVCECQRKTYIWKCNCGRNLYELRSAKIPFIYSCIFNYDYSGGDKEFRTFGQKHNHVKAYLYVILGSYSGVAEGSCFLRWYGASTDKQSTAYYSSLDTALRPAAELNLQHIRFFLIHSFSNLSDDRSNASSKTMPPHSAI